MGKAEINKQQKLEALYESAYSLYLKQGIEKTSISEITKKAGVAKGTFYLYCTDKYEMRDRLIARTCARLFQGAFDALAKTPLSSFEDRMIFVVNYILDYLVLHTDVLQFVSKNLSWGVFHHAMSTTEEAPFNSPDDFVGQIQRELERAHIRQPDIMLFLVIELASSASFSTILEQDPVSFTTLRPYLNESIRAIIRAHTADV